MKPIKSFGDARRRLDEIVSIITDIRAFLDMADKTISAVNVLKGEPEEASTGPKPHTNGAGDSWSARVLQVFKQTADKPMFQKEAMVRYQEMGFPVPTDRKEFYRQISGAVSYLANKKKLLVKTDNGYQLA